MHRQLALLVITICVSLLSRAQGPSTYGLFHIQGEDVFWQNAYVYRGNIDSIRPLVVQMLKSKYFTTNVFRSQDGYNGEIRHYKVDCSKYERTYFRTPRIYCEGEWTGKFIVRMAPNEYEVIVYALYYEKVDPAIGHYGKEKVVKGRYIDAVTKKGRTRFKESEFPNLALMSVGLRDHFDIKNTVMPDKSN